MTKGRGLFLILLGSAGLAQAMDHRDDRSSATGNQSTGVQRMDHAMHELQLAAGNPITDIDDELAAQDQLPVVGSAWLDSDEESPEVRSDRALVRGYESAARRLARTRPVNDHQRNQQTLLAMAQCLSELRVQIGAYDAAHKTKFMNRLGRALNGVEEAQARIQNYENGISQSDSDIEGSDGELEILTHMPPAIGLPFGSRVGQ